MKIQILFLRLASGMSQDTKCDKKIWYWNQKFVVFCPLPDNVNHKDKKKTRFKNKLY